MCLRLAHQFIPTYGAGCWQRGDQPAHCRCPSRRLCPSCTGPSTGGEPGHDEQPPDRGEGFAYYETVGGGQGDKPTGSGMSGVHTGITNTKNTPTESLESHYPFRVVRYALRRGSGGDGLHPGGEGIEREIEFLRPATVSLMGERRRNRP